MITVLQLLVGAMGLLFFVIGIGFLVRPAKTAVGFHLTAQGSQGLATLRADMTAFFLGVGSFALAGAWLARADLLLVPLVMVAVAFLGRAVSLFADGANPTAYPPMAVEAVMIALLLAARWTFGQG